MIGDCHCCGYEGIKVETYAQHGKDPTVLCSLCANSMAGVSFEYSYDDLRVLRTICYVGNTLLHGRFAGLNRGAVAPQGGSMAEQDFININLDDVDDGTDPIPAGLQLCRVASAQKKHKEGSEYPYIDVRLSPLEVEEKFLRRKLFLTLSFHPAAQWNLKRFMKAAHVEWKPEGFHLEDFLGKELYVTVTHKPDQNDPSAVRAEVSPPYSKA